MISAIVITKNEEARIAECLDSLAWCDEVVVVDAESSDRTTDIARARGARVFVRPWTGYADQRNFAIDQCAGDWVLYLDADERLADGFDVEARRVEATPGVERGYWVSSREFFMGDYLRHGGFGLHQANRKVRFWQNRPEHRFSGSVHERVEGPTPLGHFRAHVDHHSTASTLSGLIAKLNRYTDLEQHDAPVRRAALVLSPARVFLSRYVRHAGFRDGARGFVIAQAYAFYELVRLAKALERQARPTAPLSETPAPRSERPRGR